MTVTVGNVDAVRGLLAQSIGVLFLCCGICVGGDMNSVMVDKRGFVRLGFGVLFRYSGIFVDGIMASVDCCLISGTK